MTLGHHLPEFFEELKRRGPVDEQTLLEYPFREVSPLTRAADVFWVNSEGTFTRSEDKTEKNFNFKADPVDARILQAAGVDVAQLANNHLYDYGPAGVIETRKTLEQAGIAVYGAGQDLAEARKPVLLERNGLKLGFLGYLYMGEHSIEPEALYATPEKPGIAGTHMDYETIRSWVLEDVSKLRPQVDFVFVGFHWGREGKNLIEPYQRELAHAAVEAGADAVVGHHPHVLQGFEMIGEVPVYYSLGNFVFAGNWNPRRKDAGLLELIARKDGEGKKSVKARLIPISVDRQPGFPFQPYLYPPAEAARVERLASCYLSAKEEGECEAKLGLPYPVKQEGREPPRP